MACPVCEHSINEDVSKCPHCGWELGQYLHISDRDHERLEEARLNWKAKPNFAEKNLEREPFETWEEYKWRLEGYEYIYGGEAEFESSQYDIDEMIYPLKLRLEGWVENLNYPIDRAYISISPNDAKYLEKNHKVYFKLQVDKEAYFINECIIRNKNDSFTVEHGFGDEVKHIIELDNYNSQGPVHDYYLIDDYILLILNLKEIWKVKTINLINGKVNSSFSEEDIVENQRKFNTYPCLVNGLIFKCNPIYRIFILIKPYESLVPDDQKTGTLEKFHAFFKLSNFNFKFYEVYSTKSKSIVPMLKKITRGALDLFFFEYIEDDSLDANLESLYLYRVYKIKIFNKVLVWKISKIFIYLWNNEPSKHIKEEKIHSEKIKNYKLASPSPSSKILYDQGCNKKLSKGKYNLTAQEIKRIYNLVCHLFPVDVSSHFVSHDNIRIALICYSKERENEYSPFKKYIYILNAKEILS